MLPPPPVRFSTTAGCLRRSCRPFAISRATMSLEPPGVNGTMMRMVLLGKFCAPAVASDAARKAQAAMSFFMVSPVDVFALLGLDPGGSDHLAPFLISIGSLRDDRRNI